MILKTENIKTITIFCNENNCSDTRQMLFFASLNLLPVSKGLFFLRCFIYNMITFFCFNFKNFKTKSNIFPPSIEKVALKRHFPKVKSQRLWSHDCGFFFPIIVHIPQSHPVNSSGSRMRLKGMTTDSNR